MSSRQVRDKTGDEVPDWIADEKRRAERIRKAQAEPEAEAKARRRRHRLPCLVTGGGVSDDGKHWHPARNGFLVPIRALGNLVRGKLKGAPSGLGRAESRTGKLWSRSLCEQLIMSTSYDVFDDSYVHRVNLYLSSSDWKQFRRHYKENIWFEAEFYWGDEKLRSVGIRSRGMSSRDGDKPGILIEFDHFKLGRELFGLKSLVLRNMAPDGSFMRERLANRIFIRSGLVAPRMVSAKVLVNDEYVGLYAMTESVDRNFLCSRFGKTKGNLFKYRWKDEWYFEERKKLVTKLFSPRTQVGEPNDSGIKDLVDAINNGSIFDIGEKLDLEWTLRYLAVENAIAEIDGLVGDWGVNNFYIYEGEDGRFRLIPWDMEAGFDDADHSIWNNADDNCLTRGLFQYNKMQKRYREALWEVVKKSVNEDWLIPEIDRIEDQIRKAAYNDPFVGNFKKQVEKLRKFARKRKDSVRKQLGHNVILPFVKY